MAKNIKVELYVRRYRRPVTVAIAKEIFSALGREDLSDLLDSDPARLVQVGKPNPSDYTCASAFSDDYLCASLLSKIPWDLGMDRRQAAIDSFEAAEARCAGTNQKFEFLMMPGRESIFSPVLNRARSLIRSALGRFDWAEVGEACRFSKGASTRLPRRQSDLYYKLGPKPHATLECSHVAYHLLPLFFPLLAKLWGGKVEGGRVVLPPIDEWLGRSVTVVRGNKLAYVPKNSKTDRSIAIEPDLNMFFQLGLGKMIRKRLRRVGIDLNDQSRNQILAETGSVDGSLATIDLASASDTMSSALVEYLLPEEWFYPLDLLRSRLGSSESGEVTLYRKFSSMGNGFTFELESLIFWALSKACTELCSGDRNGVVSVYGDDIIVTTATVPSLVTILSFCGFDCNREKSFWSGPFRESCGKHYFRGTDVTPFYIRNDVDRPSQSYLIANAIRRWSRLSYGLDHRMFNAYTTAISPLPRQLRSVKIPEGVGDGGLIADFDDARPRKARRGYCGWRYHHFHEVAITTRPRDNRFWYKCIIALEQIEGRETTVNTGKSRHAFGEAEKPIQVWPSYGPWLC